VKSVVVEPNSPGRLAISEVPAPVPDSTDVVVRVHAFSLNRGEVKRAESMAAGTQLGWDFAGTVDQAARDGTGPTPGQRVVGFSRRLQGWAEFVSVPARDVAVIPDGVTDCNAATLPVAGLTALYALERCNRLLANRVLVTGATGGVGYFACQLASLMGARVTAQVRRAEQADVVRTLGVEPLVTETGEGISDRQKFSAIIDGIGGELLAHLLPLLDENGRAILYGVSGSREAVLSIRDLMLTGDGRVEGFHLYRETEVVAARKGLERLPRLLAQGRLRTLVTLQSDWSNVGTVASRLIERAFVGKAVLRLV
jgi:NADPH:quinone reductase